MLANKHKELFVMFTFGAYCHGRAAHCGIKSDGSYREQSLLIKSSGRIGTMAQSSQ